MTNSSQLSCGGPFKFPMQVGNKSSYEKLPWTDGNGYDAATCEVKGEEKISVAAGSFDTLRTECVGYWNRVIREPGANQGTNGRIKIVAWYAPSIGTMVKGDYFNFNSYSPLPFAKRQTELTSFIAGK